MMVRDQEIVLLDSSPEELIVVKVIGEHDLYTASEIKAHLADAIERTPVCVVDLGEATFIDSSVLSALLDAHELARAAKRGFAVYANESVSPAAYRAFETTGLIPILPVLPTLEKAISFARSGH